MQQGRAASRQEGGRPSSRGITGLHASEQQRNSLCKPHWPEASLPADADDTLRKQQESAAKLKQDFEGLHQPEPDTSGNRPHTSNQVPFHEEELALPRQQDQAVSTSGSVRPAAGPESTLGHSDL